MTFHSGPFDDDPHAEQFDPTSPELLDDLDDLGDLDDPADESA